MIGKDEGGIKYVLEQVNEGKILGDIHRHFLKRFIVPELDHKPKVIPASQVSYSTKIVSMGDEEDDNITDRSDAEGTAHNEVGNSEASKDQEKN